MSYPEKKTITSIVTGIFVLAAYCIYAFNNYPVSASTLDELKFWASTMLIFIGIGVAATIVIQIVFHILLSIAIAMQKKIRDENCDDKEIEKTIGAEMIEDEMDKLIELKSMRVGFFFAGIGFVAGLVALILDYSPVVMLNIFFLSFAGGSLLDGFTQLYFYRKGITNG